MLRKAQASMEYLTTYAWAFIIITITLGTLYSFGLLDFIKYTPQRCIFPFQLKCLDFALTPSGIKLQLTNNLGEDIEVTSFRITNDANPPISCTSTPAASLAIPFSWAQAKETVVTFSPCTGGGYIPNSRVELRVSVEYYSLNTPSRPLHTVNGKINGKVTSS